MRYIWLIIPLLIITACTSPPPSVLPNVEHCGKVIFRVQDSAGQKTAHCFYDGMVDCDPKSMEVVMGDDKGPSVYYLFSIVEDRGTHCLLHMNVTKSTKNVSSGVAIMGGGDPHVGSDIFCEYKKSKTSRIENNDMVYSFYLPQAMAEATKKDICTGPLVDLWKQDAQMQTAFQEALQSLDPSKCNGIPEDHYREDCRKTINSINNKDSELCNSVQDAEMKFVCLLRMIGN